MKKISRDQKKSKIHSPINLIFVCLATTTLYFKPDIQDPFNTAKQWVLLLFAFWLFGYIFSSFETIGKNKLLRQYTLVIAIFILTMLMSSITSEDLYNSFIGEVYRKNGFLSYLSLCIISLVTAIFFKQNNIKKFYIFSFGIGTVLSIYGLIQHTGKDFIKWNNHYNNIIGTLGNPNFAAAVMAIIGVLVFASVLNSNFNKYYRFASLVLFINLLVVIYLSNASQGMVSLLFGIGIYVTLWSFLHSRKLGVLLTALGLFGSSMLVLGMLQIGPLTELIYKETVSIRGYYWRAGVEMFLQNPLLGVGIDNYGLYFKQLREVNYSLIYGMEITNNNAHNTIIQMFATGGIFMGIAYLILTAFIFWRGFLSIKKSKDNNRLFVAGIFSAWIAFQAQSIVSIDNLGISIWGYILAGLLVATSLDNKNENELDLNKSLINLKIYSREILKPIVSFLFIIPAVVFVSLMHAAETKTYEIGGLYNPSIQANRDEFYRKSVNTLSNPLVDNFYKLDISAKLFEYGFTTEPIFYLNKIVKRYPRELQTLEVLSRMYESVLIKKPEEAIKYRLQIAKYDPWNAQNYLQLGINYKLIGDFENMNKMSRKILSFAEKTPQGDLAKTELKQ
jgi:O-antigen ligase